MADNETVYTYSSNTVTPQMKRVYSTTTAVTPCEECTFFSFVHMHSFIFRNAALASNISITNQTYECQGTFMWTLGEDCKPVCDPIATLGEANYSTLDITVTAGSTLDAMSAALLNELSEPWTSIMEAMPLGALAVEKCCVVGDD